MPQSFLQFLWMIFGIFTSLTRKNMLMIVLNLLVPFCTTSLTSECAENLIEPIWFVHGMAH